MLLYISSNYLVSNPPQNVSTSRLSAPPILYLNTNFRFFSLDFQGTICLKYFEFRLKMF
jgi:hypothetical protein